MSVEHWLATWHRLSDVVWYKEEDGGFRHRFAVPGSRVPRTMEAWGLTAAELVAVPVVAGAVKVLTFAVGRPKRAREIMECEGLIVHDLDDPWQKLVLTLYSELVTTTEAARRALAGLGLGVADEPGGTDYAGYSEAELSWQGEDDAKEDQAIDRP